MEGSYSLQAYSKGVFAQPKRAMCLSYINPIYFENLKTTQNPRLMWYLAIGPVWDSMDLARDL